MIYELDVLTCRPGGHLVLARHDADTGRRIRGDRFGTPVGCWLSEHGTLNQFLQLWSFESREERARLSAALSRDERWKRDYWASAEHLLVRRETRILESFLPFEPPSDTGNIYEFRMYRTRPGMARAWCRLFAETMPVRKRYGGPVCAWIGEREHSDEVSHLWAYSSLTDRLESRARAARDPDWQAFVKAGGAMLEEMHSTVMLPAEHSPCR